MVKDKRTKKKLELEDLALMVKQGLSETEDLAAMVKRGFDDVDKRFDDVDKRFDDVDQRFDDVDKRFESVDQRFESMDRRMTLGFASLQAEINEIKQILEPLVKMAFVTDKKVDDLERRVALLEARS